MVNLISLLLGAGGLFAALTEYKVPELRASFWEQNPFALKAEIIKGVMAWLFTVLALVALVLQVIVEIAGGHLSERRYGAVVYLLFTLGGVLVTAAIVWCLGRMGLRIARSRWRPEVIASTRQVFEASRFIVDHDGWREDQAGLRTEPIKGDEHRRANFETAERRLTMIERLLELDQSETHLSGRVRNLARYFDEV